MSLPLNSNALPVGAGILQDAISRGGLIPPSDKIVPIVVAAACALCAAAGGLCTAIKGTIIVTCSVCIVGMICESQIEMIQRQIKQLSERIAELHSWCSEPAQLERYGSEGICFISCGGAQLIAHLEAWLAELTKYLRISPHDINFGAGSGSPTGKF